MLARDKACKNLLHRFLLNKFCFEAGPVCLALSNPALIFHCVLEGAAFPKHCREDDEVMMI